MENSSEKIKSNYKKYAEPSARHILSAQQNKILTSSGNKLQQKNQEINNLKSELLKKNDEIAYLRLAMESKEKSVQMIYDSESWKLGHRLVISLKAIKIVKIFKTFLEKFINRKYATRESDPYKIWMNKNRLKNNDIIRIKQKINELNYKPQISIIATFHSIKKEKFIKKCIESVLCQFYENWELIIICDESTKKIIDPNTTNDKRIKIKSMQNNSKISIYLNQVLKSSAGEFIGLINDYGQLSQDALFENINFLNRHPEANMIYSDEDEIDNLGKRTNPFFKPDWSPDLFLSMMYTGNLCLFKKSLIAETGGFRSEFIEPSNYDLVLRLTERTDKIFHIAKVLYHRYNIELTDENIDKAKQALKNALKRRNVNGDVIETNLKGKFRIRYEIIDNPKVIIAILTGGKLDLLKGCVESILSKSTYKNYELLIIDNSLKKETREYLFNLKKKYPSRINFYENNLRPFNFSALYNKAFSKIDALYTVLLNDDIKIITPDWIEAMLEHCQRKEVGIVGCKLLYPTETIQHAGVVMGIFNHTGHAFKGISNNDLNYYFGLPHLVRNVSAVTFACAMIKTDLYKELGGLDEKNLKVAFNDTDFCLKTREKDYQIIYTPYAELYHLESITKHTYFLPGENDYSQKKWIKVIKRDPYYNPNLLTEDERFKIKI